MIENIVYIVYQLLESVKNIVTEEPYIVYQLCCSTCFKIYTIICKLILENIALSFIFRFKTSKLLLMKLFTYNFII